MNLQTVQGKTTMTKMKKAIPLLLTAGFLICLTSCIHYTQKYELNMDGSGSVQIHYWADENIVSYMDDEVFAFDETKIRKNYEGEGISVLSVKIELHEEDSTRHAYVDVAFDDITTLPKAEAFKGTSITWKDAGNGKKEFIQTVKTGDDEAEPGLERFKATYIYDMPGKVLESNATETDGNTLTWKYTLTDLKGGGVTMKAVVEDGGMQYFVVVIVVIIGGGIIMMIVILASRKKTKSRGAATDEAAHSDEGNKD